MVVQSAIPPVSGNQGVTLNNINTPTEEDGKMFAGLMSNDSDQVKPERNAVQLLQQSDAFLNDKMESIKKLKLMEPKAVLRSQLLLAEFHVAYNFGVKVVGSLSQSLNKLDTMS